MGKTLVDRGIDPHADPESLTFSELWYSVKAWEDSPGPQGQLRAQRLQRELDRRIEAMVRTSYFTDVELERTPIYLHRAIDGFCFVSFGRDLDLEPPQGSTFGSIEEYVEGIVFEQPWADEWLGTSSPSEVDTMDVEEWAAEGRLPIERDREHDYRVGTLYHLDGVFVEADVHEPEVED